MLSYSFIRRASFQRLRTRGFQLEVQKLNFGESSNFSQDRQGKAYKYDPKVNLILKANANDVVNT
jgi:hypothetical protein